ncbi:MAG TPA: hypothetical protein VN822_04405 [Candidatus Acidoferrales bacterium]|nr:hypothetical protein [Candidatus Acidoferrales bacterium]
MPLLFALFGLLFLSRPAFATITYDVSLEHASQHTFQVRVIIPQPAAGIVVAMPAWNALYQVRDFSYRVRNVRASGKAPDNIRYFAAKVDKQTWRIEFSSPAGSQRAESIFVDYSIQWDDPGPFDSQLSDRHAFMNLAEILMYVPDRRSEDTQITFENVPTGWNFATELAGGAAPLSFSARSYDALVDAPVEAGKFDEFEFDSGGAHFRVVVDAPDWNKRLLGDSLSRLTAYELNLMGGPPFDTPRKEYTFFFHIGPYADVGGGGMEHSNSTAIAATSTEGAAAIAAHEFFHVWNVKRIRPQALEPVDYTKEQYTRALWFAEGVTSTYAAFALERTGLWSKAQFYTDLASEIGRLQSRPAHAWQSVEESSLDAWFEKYDDYNVPDRSISYYNKGQIVGVLLDLAIRDATENRKSLDDVLRRMNDEYARQGKFYDESAGIRGVVEEVAGKSFEDFFRRYVSGTDEIPYNDLLGVAGLELKTETATAAPGMPAGVHASISEIGHATERQRRIREGLLRGSTD